MSVSVSECEWVVLCACLSKGHRRVPDPFCRESASSGKGTASTGSYDSKRNMSEKIYKMSCQPRQIKIKKPLSCLFVCLAVWLSRRLSVWPSPPKKEKRGAAQYNTIQNNKIEYNNKK